MYIKLAYVAKAHGIEGEVFIRPFNPRPDWPVVREVFIDGRAFSVINYRPHKEGLIFKLQGCDSRQEASALRGKGVFFLKKLFESNKKKGEPFYLAEILSFQVESPAHGIIGQIHSFQSGKLQDFLYVVCSKEFNQLETESSVYLKKTAENTTIDGKACPIFENEGYHSPLQIEFSESCEERSQKTEILGKGRKTNQMDYPSGKGKQAKKATKSKQGWMIPFVKPYIKEINFSAKKVILDLPEDFLQVFASSFKP